MLHRLFILTTCCLSLTLQAQSSASTEASPEPAEILKQMETIPLNIARNGEEVIVSWKAPAVPVRAFEIFRNESDTLRGRVRVALIRADREIVFDTLPDKTGTYWYWAKVASYDGQVVNVGPVATPSAVVWMP